MAEDLGVLREVQLNAEGEWVLVPARGSRRSKVGKDDSAAVGATKADRKMAFARNKDVGSFIGVTKAELANKKAAPRSDFGTSGKPAAGNMSATGREPGPKEQRKVEPAVSLISKETVPQCFIDRIKTHPSRKLPPLSQEVTELYEEFFPDEPETIAQELENITRWNYLVDLEQDCLRQHEEKGYAEVGVDFTKGIKQLFILPQQ